MRRKLLPYEHELIEHLGVTADEYLDFLNIQIDHTISTEQRIATPQCGPAIPAAFAAVAAGTATAVQTTLVLATISTALTVVGIVFQVAAALLADKPSSPKAQGNQREQRFSPRFGFNGAQELAQYGDPVNLVYCNINHNPKGSVRVSTSLVWSSVESYGSTQFMQLLLVLGAAQIKTLDFSRTAFGQLPLGQFSGSNTWLYYKDDGLVSFNDKVLGDGKDPTRDGADPAEDVCRVMFAKNRRDGYSQTFSPSSLTTIGVYDAIPINVDLLERTSEGKTSWRNLRVIIAQDSYNTSDGAYWDVGQRFTVIFREAEKQGGVVIQAARDMRYQLVSSLDQAATYMLGTAKFKLVSVEPDNMNLDANDISAKFECIEKGRRPSTRYDKTKSKISSEQDREDIGTAIERLEPDADYSFEEIRDLIINGTPIVTLESKGDITIKLKKYGYQDYEFAGTETLEWTDELDVQHSVTLPKGGSIATSEAILEEFIANKPKLDTRALQDEINDDLEQLRQVIDDIETGNFDALQFRKAAKQAASAIRVRIKERQQEKQDLMDLLDIQDNDIRTISGENVLGKNTELNKQYQRLVELDDKITNLQEEKDDIMSDNMAVAKKKIIKFYRDTTYSFSDFNGNLYSSGGIRAMKRRLAQLKGRFTTDQLGVRTIQKFLKNLINQKKQALEDATTVYKNWDTLAGLGDDNFFTKCLVKAESAAYQTVTACDYVKFSIRCKIFRRVSGRAKDYGVNEAPDGFKLSDNGIKARMAFFKVAYRKIGDTVDSYRNVPIVFAVRRSADQDNFIGLAFKGSEKAKWEFKIDPIGDIGAEIEDSGQKAVAFIENAGKMQTYDYLGSNFAWTGSLVDISLNIKNALKERGPIYTNEWDLFSVRSDTQVQFSFDAGPEFRITAVTEQQVESNTGKYTGMSTMALGVFSGRGVQDLRSITAYVTQGKSSWRVNEATGALTYSNNSSSFAPDIFADTILDKENGIGKFAKSEGIDWNGVALAKRFCKNNGLGCQLFMDGVVAEQTPWRQFWAETAPFSLLEFARVGGRETLIPAVPVNAAGVANREVIVNALFTAGNVLEGSYKEEFIDYGSAVQDLIATVIYRETESQDVFPRNSSVTVSRANVSADVAILQSFDLSQFVTQREQAILFAKLLCNQRRHIRRGIEFKTFPTDTPISPGAYIYVDIGLVTWDRISSGIILQGGELNSPLLQGIPNGSYSVLAYQSSTNPISFTNVTVSNGIAASLAEYAGYMFVLGAVANRKRVFRVTEVQMDEEGEVTVKGVEHPCEEIGGKLLSKVADFSDALFTVR